MEKELSKPTPYSISSVLVEFIREALRKGYLYFVFPSSNGNNASVELYIEINKKELSLTKDSIKRGVLRRLISVGFIIEREINKQPKYLLNPASVRYFKFGETKSLLYDELPIDFELGLKIGKRKLQIYGDMLNK